MLSCKNAKRTFSRGLSFFLTEKEKKRKSKSLSQQGQFCEYWKPFNSNKCCRRLSFVSWIKVGETWKKLRFSKENWVNILRNLISSLNSAEQFRYNILKFQFLLVLNANSQLKWLKQRHCYRVRCKEVFFQKFFIILKQTRQKKIQTKSFTNPWSVLFILEVREDHWRFKGA